MRDDKLREQRGQKDDAFRVGQIDEHGAFEQSPTGLRIRQRVQVN